jgi:hypothetical protein
MQLRRVLAAAALPGLCTAVDPAAVYDGGYGSDHPILLGIGNGGAGQSGLIEGMTSLLQAFELGPD